MNPKKSPRERFVPKPKVICVVLAGDVLGRTLSNVRVLLLVVVLYTKLKVGVKDTQGEIVPVQIVVSSVASSFNTDTVE